MAEIQRYGGSRRWADVVVHRGVAPWVELATHMSLDARGQIAQVLISVADEHDGPVLNELWDAWVPADHPPVRSMVQVGLGKTCKVEMVVTALVPEG